jgi:hypothetical protein
MWPILLILISFQLSVEMLDYLDAILELKTNSKNKRLLKTVFVFRKVSDIQPVF